jgi:hypothetical protein
MNVETPVCDVDRAILSRAQGKAILSVACGCCGVAVGLERRRYRGNRNHGWVELAWRCSCRDAEKCALCGRCGEHCRCA